MVFFDVIVDLVFLFLKGFVFVDDLMELEFLLMIDDVFFLDLMIWFIGFLLIVMFWLLLELFIVDCDELLEFNDFVGLERFWLKLESVCNLCCFLFDFWIILFRKVLLGDNNCWLFLFSLKFFFEFLFWKFWDNEFWFCCCG